jgi:hypothetical protein
MTGGEMPAFPDFRKIWREIFPAKALRRARFVLGILHEPVL